MSRPTLLTLVSLLALSLCVVGLNLAFFPLFDRLGCGVIRLDGCRDDVTLPKVLLIVMFVGTVLSAMAVVSYGKRIADCSEDWSAYGFLSLGVVFALSGVIWLLRYGTDVVVFWLPPLLLGLVLATVALNELRMPLEERSD